MPTITRNGVRLHHLDEGPAGAPAVVLLHAFPLNSGMWEPQIAALRGPWRVIAPDFKGLGRSEAVEDPTAYSVASYADDVRAALDEAGVPATVLVGLSMGGYVAFAFLQRHADLVRGLVLADTRATADSPEERARRVDLQQKLREGDVAAVAGAAVENIVGAHSSRREEALAEARRLAAQGSRAGLIGAAEALKRRPDVTSMLSGIAVPTQILVGEQDKTSPPAVAHSMGEAIPDVRVTVLPDAGHLSSMENPAAFNEALIGFLRRECA